MAKTKPYPVRLGEVREANIKKTAKKVNLSFPDTMRQAVDFGLPVLEQRLGKQEMKL